MNETDPDHPDPTRPSSTPDASGAGRATRRRPTVLEVAAGVLVLVGIGVLVWSLVRDDDDSGGATASVPITTDSGLNISCFVYRDVDRDGTYDLDDFPYAALTVTGEGPATAATTQSNTAGFANFVMALDGEQALVDRAGTYRFEARPPDGWDITSGPADQEVEFEEVTGSPSGVGPLRECRPYGLAPTLTISGPSGDGAVAIERDGTAVDVAMADGSFTADVEPGEHRVAAAGAERSIVVAEVPVVVSGANDAGIEPRPNEVTVSFDDFTAANTLVEIPNEYGGLDWANWVAAHRILYGAPGYVNTGASGEFVAYNSSGQPARVSADEPFDFVGAYLGVAWPAAEAHDVVIRAARDGEVVHTDTLRLSTAGAVWFAADYRGIDEIEVSSDGNWQVVVDDATFRTS